MNVKVRIIERCRGSLDGGNVRAFAAGEVLELATPRELDLGHVFVRLGWAEEVEPGDPSEGAGVAAAESRRPESAPQVQAAGRRRGRG